MPPVHDDGELYLLTARYRLTQEQLQPRLERLAILEARLQELVRLRRRSYRAHGVCLLYDPNSAAVAIAVEGTDNATGRPSD